ncbi:Glycosyltransferase AglI [uncultured archaeon]|nr:Glycosyltransferase AglI [uncultured archaeon]
MKRGVSCIVPAYNEEGRIGNVLRVLEKHPLLKEVIVINDCSTDNTEEEVKKFKGVKLIINPVNKGKSFSVMRGIRSAKGDLVMLIDADLVGLTKKSITDLAKPLIDGEADVSISLRNLFWSFVGIDFLSGERVFHKFFFKNYKSFEKLPGFGLEVAMNRKIIREKLRIKIVTLKGVISPYKSKKFGFFAGIKGDIIMTKQIIKVVGFWGAVSQIAKLSSLKV